MSKTKGSCAERELIHMFWKEEGWSAHRIAGSGSSKYPSPDVIAGNRRRRLAIECKVTKFDYQYLGKEEVGMLKEFSDIFGAEPWIAVKFNRIGWYFLNPDDLKETEKNLVVKVDEAKNKGLLFDELIEK